MSQKPHRSDSQFEVVIPFAQISAINPNLSQDYEEATNVYLRCIVVSFYTFRRFNPLLPLVLVTNKPVQQPFKNQLKELEVVIRIVEFNHDPINFSIERFRGCFYLLDAIIDANMSMLIVDPDVICIDSISSLEPLAKSKYGVFTLDYPVDENINGISRREASNLWNKYLIEAGIPEVKTTAPHLGGEIMFVPIEELDSLKEDLRSIWDWMTQQNNEREMIFPTEEHVLSNLLHRKDTVSLNGSIARIWTTITFTKHQGNTGNIHRLAMWHLPSEKSRGFLKCYEMINEGGIFIAQDDDLFRKNLARLMNITRIDHKIISNTLGPLVHRFRLRRR